MTIAIKRDNGDLLWFDAVLQFSRKLGGTVSKHPLETGAVITDHTTLENETIMLSGVISDADFNMNRPSIGAEQAKLYGITNKQFVNNTPVTKVTTGNAGEELYNNVIISGPDDLTRFLPGSIGQFFGTAAPTVTLDERTPSKVMPALAVQGYLVSMFNQREAFVLLSFVDGRIEEAFTNCVMTSLEFAEDAESGDAVYPIINIERVRYATSTYVKIQTKADPAIANQAAVEKNNGKQQTVAAEVNNEELNPQQPQANAKKTNVSAAAQVRPK